MPFKSLTDLPMRINPQMKKNSVYPCPTRKWKSWLLDVDIPLEFSSIDLYGLYEQF